MEDVEYIVKNLEIICRICLHTCNEMKSIFSFNIDEKQLLNMIRECNFIKLHDSDRFPKNICIHCIDNIKKLYDFQRQCQNSNKILLDIIGDDKNDELVNLNVLNDFKEIRKIDESTQTDCLNNFNCEICNLEYETNDALVAHKLTHKGDTLKCKKCSKVYTRLYQFERHLANMHPELIKNNGNNDQNNSNNIKSEKIVSNKEIDNATTIFSNDFLKSEFLEVKTEEIDDNEATSFSEQNEYILNDLSKNNSSENSKKKRKYSTDSDSSSSFDHLFTITVPDEAVKTKKTVMLNCEACDKVFYRMQNLLQHERTHRFDSERRSKCDLCPLTFVSSYSLAIHKRKDHTPKKIKEKIINNEKTEICEICKKGFSKLKYLKNHKRTHQPRKCKLCDEFFTNKVELQEHKKTHAAERPYLCTECGMRFVRNDFLEVHMRRHTGEKPFKCRYCEKGFACSTELSLHERYHTGKKPHLCTICGKGFPRSYSLAVHTRIHTGERPYKCSHCEKTFVQCKDLKAHVQRHTGERYKCELCGDCFVQQYLLTQHKRDRHGINIKSHIGRVKKFLTPPDESPNEPIATATSSNSGNDLLPSKIEIKNEPQLAGDSENQLWNVLRNV